MMNVEEAERDAEKKNEHDAARNRRHQEWVRDIDSICIDQNCGTIDNRDDNRGER